MKKVSVIFIVSVGLLTSACVTNPNTAVLTPILGAAGGFAGSQFGKGTGKIAATAGGALLGALFGNHIGGVFDGVSHNRSAINRNHLLMNQLRQKQSASPSVIHSQHHYQQRSGTNLDLNCSVRNNYVVCNGS
mgnify:FL=1